MKIPIPSLGIVLPCFNEEEIFLKTDKKIGELLDQLISLNLITDESKIVYVDDGSLDKTWELIQKSIDLNTNRIGVKFSRNFDYMWIVLLLVALIIYPGTLSHYGVMLLFVTFQFFENIQIKFKWYFTSLLIGVIYFLNPISLFTSLCMVLIIFIVKPFLNPNFKKIGNERF